MPPNFVSIPPANPPHGGSWQRLADGTLRLVNVTQQRPGRIQRPGPAPTRGAAPDTPSSLTKE